MSVSAERQPAQLDAEAIWQEFHRRLFGFIARRVSDRDSAEDILQEVIVRIHRHAAELELPPAVGAWVHRIARNAIADHYRRASVRRERPAGLALDGDEVPVPDAASGKASWRACRLPSPIAGAAAGDPPRGAHAHTGSPSAHLAFSLKHLTLPATFGTSSMDRPT